MSAMGGIPIQLWMERVAVVRRLLQLRSAIDALQLPLGFRDGGLGILGAGAVVGEHVDHDEVGDRGRRLLAGRADARRRQRALARPAQNTAFFGSAVQTGAMS